MTNTDISKILLSLPEDLKEKLEIKAERQNRSLNNYILWLLVNRKKLNLV